MIKVSHYEREFALPLLFAILCFPVRKLTAETILETRYQKLSCAIVQVVSGQGGGTGFFINSTGRVATAAHVVFGVEYSANQQGGIQLTLNGRSNLKVFTSDHRHADIHLQLTQPDIDRASADVAIFETGLTSACHLTLGNPHSLKVGEHLISIGFPLLSPAPVLYEGFLSAHHTHLPIPVGHIGSQPIFPIYDVLRVQMPVTPGASGSPLLIDDNRVIGIISEVPVLWSTDLDNLVQAFAANPHGSGILLSGFDTTKLLAQLAWIVKEFESPGSGFAVPSSYLLLEANAKQIHQPN